MPQVTAPARLDADGKYVTYFVDSVGTTSTTYTYPNQQNELTITNRATSNLTVTVNGQNYTVSGGTTQTITVPLSSFAIAAVGGIQSFTAKSIVMPTDGKTNGFVYNADIGLRKWRIALAKLKAGQQQIYNVSMIGDSITEGQAGGGGAVAGPGSAHPTSGFAGRIRTALNAKYGDCGMGFNPSYYPMAAKNWTYAGSGWSTRAGYNEGFGIADIYSTSSSNYARTTINFTGIGFTAVFGKTPQGGTIGAFVDGNGTAAATDTGYVASGTVTNATMTVNGLASGAHSIEIRHTDTTGKVFNFIGGYPITTATAGVRINNFGAAGKQTIDHARKHSLDVTVDLMQPILTVIALMANDSNAGVDLATYKANLKTIMDRALQYGDVLFVATGLRTGDTTPIKQRKYVDTMLELALENNCAFIDMYSRWGNSGPSGNSTGLIADGVHPNDYGHQDIATAVLRVIDEY